MKKWRWIHKWFSVVFGLVLLLWAASGIILNHRSLVSNVEVSRNLLPPNLTPENWNLASVRSAINWKDGWLVWGNIGIWQTDSTFSQWTPVMQGLLKGMDNRRTMRVIRTSDESLIAATQSGLYECVDGLHWKRITLPVDDEPIMDISESEGRIYAVSRSAVFMAKSKRPYEFDRIHLPDASNEDGKTSMFRTLWVMHSGEIFGLAGKRIVDFLGLMLIFFVLTGYIYFFFPGLIKRLKKRGRQPNVLSKINRLSIKWHNKLGLWLGVFLIFSALTGMFLRPPWLIAIAKIRVKKISGTTLDHKNTWHDKLRALRFNAKYGYFLIATNEGLYYSYDLDGKPAQPFPVQPPISVMGINVLEEIENGSWLIGSFNGLFVWNPATAFIADYITGELYSKGPDVSSPIGSNMVAGMIRKTDQDFIFDYNRGLINHHLPMPAVLKELPFPLWNLALEMHTGRIFQFLIGPLYILLVPMIGIIAVLILVSGLVVYIRRRFI